MTRVLARAVKTGLTMLLHFWVLYCVLQFLPKM